MRRPLVLILSTLSLATSLQARPALDNAPPPDTSSTVGPSEPAMLMGRPYEVTKRDPLILMSPELEDMSRRAKYHRATDAPPFPSTEEHTTSKEEKTKKKKPNTRRVVPFPRLIAERALDDDLETRDIYARKRAPASPPPTPPPPARLSEPPTAPPNPPKVTSTFVTNEQAKKHAEAQNGGHYASQENVVSEHSTQGHSSGIPGLSSIPGLGLAGLGGGSGSPAGLGGLGLGGGSHVNGQNSQLNALGGLIGG